MAEAPPSTAGTGDIRTTINYLAEGSFLNRRFVAPGEEANTGEYVAVPVTVRDARPNRSAFGLDSHGFQLLHSPTRIGNFLDKDAVDALYPAEVADAVRAATGADRVATLGWMIRTSGDLGQYAGERKPGYTHQGGVQPPAGEAHVDVSPERADRMAAAIHAQRFPDAPPFRRFLYASFWRTFSPPPQDCPLAICDGRTVADDEGTPNTMFIVDAIPSREDMLRPIADEDQAIAAAVFRHRPDHAWWYFSDMTRDEALLFKFHDSRRVQPWRVPHTAFHTGLPGAHPRDSIELRVIAYFS